MRNPMKLKVSFVGIIFFIVFVLISCAKQDDFPVLKGPYLGQKPPGMTPEIFAPGIISLEGSYEGGATFSYDGTYFCYKKDFNNNPDVEKIGISKYENGKWTFPKLAPFSSDAQFSDWDFQFSSFEKKLYFTSNQPAVLNGKTLKPSNIWVTSFASGKWSKPELLGIPINVENSYSGYPSITKNGTIYFHSEREDTIGETDIYRSRYEKGEYVIENLGSPVNSPESDLDPCIAPDESYLLFLSRRNKNTEYNNHLFVSFRDENDQWSDPVDLDPILGVAALPGISPDGKYIFFTKGDYNDSNSFDIYWVDATFIEKFKPDTLK